MLIPLIFMVVNSIINLVSKIYHECERMEHYVTIHNTLGVLEYLIITPQFDNAIVPFSKLAFLTKFSMYFQQILPQIQIFSNNSYPISKSVIMTQSPSHHI